MSALVRVLLISAFVASLAALVIGCVVHPEIFDERWGMQTKIKGLVGYIVGFAGLAGLGYRFWPGVAHRVLVLAGVLLLVLAVGLLAPLVVALVLLSSLCLGDGILRRWLPEARRDATDQVLACLLGLVILASTVGWLSHFHVHYWYTYLAVLVIPVVGNRQAARSLVVWWRSVDRHARTEGVVAFAALMLLWFTVGLQLFNACRPEVGYDSLVYHWPIIHTLASQHAFSYPVEDHVWAVMPMLGDWIHAMPYLFSGEAGAHLANFANLALALVLLAAACRPHASAGETRLHLALFCSTSLVYYLVGTMYIDNAVMLFSVAAVLCLVRFQHTGRRPYLYLAAVFLGAAAATKHTGWMLVAIACVVLLVMTWRQRQLRLPVTSWLGLGGVVLLVAGFPYVNAWVLTGNPVFPLFNTWFESPLFDTEVAFTNALYHHPLSYRTLFDMTFSTDRFMECTPGMLGFHYLVLWPVGVVWACSRRRPELWIVLSISVALFCAVFVFQAYLRYLYPALALATISMCAAAGGLTRGHRRLAVAMQTVLLLVLGLNLYNLPAAGHASRDFPIHDLVMGRRDKLRGVFSEHMVFGYLRRTHGGDTTVCCASSSFIADLEGRVLTWTWHSPKFAREMSAAATPTELLAVAAAYGIRHFVVVGPPRSPVFASYLERFTEVEYRYRQARLHRVR